MTLQRRRARGIEFPLSSQKTKPRIGAIERLANRNKQKKIAFLHHVKPRLLNVNDPSPLHSFPSRRKRGEKRDEGECPRVYWPSSNAGDKH